MPTHVTSMRSIWEADTLAQVSVDNMFTLDDTSERRRPLKTTKKPETLSHVFHQDLLPLPNV